MSTLLEMYLDAADGRFPPADGTVSVIPSWRAGLSAVVSFTAHAVIATDTPDVLEGVRLGAYGSALHPGVLTTLAGYPARIGVIDVTLAGCGTGGGAGGGPAALVQRADLDDHPRVLHARAIRDEVTVYGAPEGSPDQGLMTIGTGLGGRREFSIELLGAQAPGTGRRLISEALQLRPPGEPIFAAVAPGNARSLRAFLAVGFVPIGSEVIIEHQPVG